MSSTRFTKSLVGELAQPEWPDGLRLVPFEPAHRSACHRLLSVAYFPGHGTIGSLDSWWSSVENDAQFFHDGLFLVLDREGEVAAFGHCWSQAFLKDFAVASEWRRTGAGTALLLHIFRYFQARGFHRLDLKVRDGNDAAIAFYKGLGMRPLLGI